MRGRGWIGEGPRRRGVRGIVEKGAGRGTGFRSVGFGDVMVVLECRECLGWYCCCGGLVVERTCSEV